MDSYKDRVNRFASALALALYDKKIEIKGYSILFFLDADVVIKLVLGFMGNPEASEVPWPDIVRSLFSIGYFGDFYILRPHAFEFYQILETQPRYRSLDEREHLRTQASDYIDKKGIRAELQELTNVIRGNMLYPNKVKKEVVKAFLDVLREKPLETFSFIEQINGTWPQRLRRIFDKGLLKLDYLGPEINDLVLNKGSVLYKINSIIVKERPQLTINTFKDASALTALYTFVDEWEKGEKGFIARFYTETSSLINTLEKDKEIRELLTYQKSPFENVCQPECNFIHRNIDYFLMRAMFNELAPKNELQSLEKLLPLDNLLSKLQELLKEDEMYIEQAITTYTLNDNTLISLIESFERISIMDSLWIKSGIQNLLGSLDFLKPEELSEWTNIFEFAKNPRARNILDAEIKDIRINLEKQVSQINEWTKYFKTILLTRDQRIYHLKVIEDPMRDLGLIRWSYNLSVVDKHFIKEYIRALTDEPDITIIASEIATKMVIASKKVNECQYICAVLWALGRYYEIDHIIKSCRIKNPKKFPATLTLLQLAARMRIGDFSIEKERKKILSELSLLINDAPTHNRTSILLGAGYIYYHAWRQMMVKASFKDKLWDNQPNTARDWAKTSFNLGEEAYNSLHENTLAWAYAVNHCSYVGTVTGVEPDKTFNYHQILLKLKTYENIWCSRFDDTIGYYFLDHAEKVWYLSPEEQKPSLDISGDVKEAEVYFKAAKERDPGDIDIDEHLSRLNFLSDSFTDFMLKVKKD